MFKNRIKIFFVVFLCLFLVLPFSALAGRAEGGQIDRFDIQPRTAKDGETVNVTLWVTLFQEEIADACGVFRQNIFWEVYEITPNNLKNPLQPGTPEPIDSFINGVSKDLSFSKQLSPTPQGSTSRRFFATLYCPNYAGLVRRDITTSSVVELSAGSGSGACNNNNTCDAGETSATCSDCPVVPGASQSFIFKLDNPLEADNFLELIDVLATWLFNLSIPVVVVMIVWSGVIFLTSRGDTSKLQKAKDILLYAVVGFAIILIGKGFITLIESILNLGANP